MATVILWLSLFMSISANAQFPMTIRTPYGNARIPSAVPIRYPRINDDGGAIKMKRYDYSVVLKSGEVVNGTGRIQLKKGKAYIQFNRGKNTRIFYPEQTQSITKMTTKDHKMVGVPAFHDSCWLFQVSEGKINKFAIAPEWGTPFFSAIQKDKQKRPVVVSKNNVIEMVQENPAALKKAKKNKLEDAIRIYNRPF